MSLGWLLACFASNPPEAAEPPPSHEAQVVVRSYREQDISKRQGHPKVHVYVDLEMTDGAPELAEHAVDGVLKVNMPKRDLEPVTTLPWTEGLALSVQARIATTTPGYVRIVAAEVP